MAILPRIIFAATPSQHAAVVRAAKESGFTIAVYMRGLIEQATGVSAEIPATGFAAMTPRQLRAAQLKGSRSKVARRKTSSQ